MHIACCDAAGVVRFVEKKRGMPETPRGAICFARGDKSKMSAIRATLRLSYDGATYLVPGVPEAPDQNAAMDALNRYCDWLRSRRLI